MDHVINAINTFYEIEIGFLAEEWASGKCKKLSDCPSYASCKAMNDSKAVLERYYYGEKKSCSVRDEVKWRTEF